jgi:uncharacterized protein (DUF4415 family)
MSKKSIIKDSLTNWDKLKNSKEEDIDLSEIPELRETDFTKSILRLGGKKVPKRKIRINISIDADIIAYFKTISRGKGYQTLINETLKQSVFQNDLEHLLRQVIREELKTSK